MSDGLQSSLARIETGVASVVEWKAAASVEVSHLKDEVARLREKVEVLEERTAKNAWVPILITAIVTGMCSLAVQQVVFP